METVAGIVTDDFCVVFLLRPLQTLIEGGEGEMQRSIAKGRRKEELSEKTEVDGLWTCNF